MNLQNKKLKAVLFDYDGVIADTMEDNYQAWKYAFEQYKCNIARVEYMELEGMSPQGIVETLGKRYRIELALYPQIVKLKEEFYQKNNNFQLYPGIVKFLTKLKQAGLKLALVSGAAEKRLKTITPQEILDFFDTVVCADNVEKTKPHPESYQKALELLHVSPQKAVVIENSPLGIKAAKAAGLYCITVCTTLPASKLQEVDLVCTTVSELFNVIYQQI